MKPLFQHILEDMGAMVAVMLFVASMVTVCVILVR